MNDEIANSCVVAIVKILDGSFCEVIRQKLQKDCSLLFFRFNETDYMFFLHKLHNIFWYLTYKMTIRMSVLIQFCNRFHVKLVCIFTDKFEFFGILKIHCILGKGFLIGYIS